MIDVGLQEVPRCPENIDRRLKEFDRRLRCVFNTRFRVWQIQEQLANSGAWTHVLFWHEGHWSAMEFRQLPYSAEPIIAEILKRDFGRTAGLRSVGELAKKLDADGATERARRLEMARDVAKDKLRRYAAWAYDRAAIVQRKFAVGGRSRTQALKERLSILRDLGLRKD